MTQQNEKMNVLKENEQQQKMLNVLLPVIDKALKDNFATYAKLVQGDVANFVISNALKDGVVPASLGQFSKDINSMVVQVGKDLEKQIVEKFAALKETAK